MSPSWDPMVQRRVKNNRINLWAVKSQQLPKWFKKIKFKLSLFLMPGYFYIENYVDNFTAMSTSQKCYTQKKLFIFWGFYYLRGIFLVEKLSHFLTLNTLIMFCPWIKHLTIVKRKSHCLNGQQPIGKIHIMRLIIKLTFAIYMEPFISALQKEF